MQQLKHTENTCHLYFLDLLLLFWGESIYDPPLFKLTLLRLYNTIHQHYHRQIHFLSLILIDFCKKDSKRSSVILSVSLPIIISTLLLFVCIVRVSSESLEEIKLIAIVS